MLAPRSRIRLDQMQLDRLQVLRVQAQEEFRRPLKTEPAFPRAGVHEIMW